MTASNPYALETLSNLLKGKVIIVTGGNSGIGKSIVETVARLGARVVIDYRSHPEATEAIEEEIGELGGTCIGVQADVGKLDDLQRLVDAAVAQYGRLDVMVNNAGIETRTSSPLRITRDVDTLQSLNLRGLFPGGEGAGYAGGILSAGVDGIKLAEAVARSINGVSARQDCA